MTLYSNDEQFISSFGHYLFENQILDKAALNRAINAQKNSDERFDKVLTHLGIVSETVLFDALSDYTGLQRFEAALVPPSAIFEKELPFNFLKLHFIAPLSHDEAHIKLATSDPFNSDVAHSIAYQVNRTVEMVLATPTEIETILATVYSQSDVGEPQDQNSEGSDFTDESDIQRLKDIANDAPVIQFVNQLIAKAIDQNASDIHVESKQDRITIRFRLDGILKVDQEVSSAMKDAIISRIKILAHLDIAEKRRPQDGRIKYNFRGREIDLRISTTPTITGESVVLRILDTSHVDLNFTALGMDEDCYKKYSELLGKPNGIILVTGPTGSGKTTTLYTSLELLNQPDRKIFTVEDPVEYQLKGINQVQVKSSIGFTFANALRSILRQDPDIIMIGEIRDVETAQIAVQAALTGHLVFATLHTNSAAASITRLLDMGIEDYLLASTIIGVMAQRLVRKTCKHCSSYEQNDIKTSAPSNGEKCEHCNHSGYKGRTMIMELLVMEDRIQKMILENKSAPELEEKAIECGMKTLKEQGLEKIKAGITNHSEIIRVMGID